MRAIFVHASDTHFGQDVGKHTLHKHNDIKECLLEDVDLFFQHHPAGKATGILLAGDLAYKGQASEYKEAGEWLDRLTVAARCKPHAVQIVPGNHDIDRTRASPGVRLMLDHLASPDGDLTEYLAHEYERKGLYGRFEPYSEFAEAYDCSVDVKGGPVGVWRVPLGQGRTLKILGLNSAILCRQSDKPGDMRLGPYQQVIERPRRGEFLVVMIHHPLPWIGDGGDTLRYMKTRACVLITGHEHSNKSELEDGLLSIDAGAVIPPLKKGMPETPAKYQYSYNIVEFVADGGAKGADALNVKIHTRVWSDEKMNFVAQDGVPKEFSLPVKLSRGKFAKKSKKPVSRSRDDAIASIIYRFFRHLSQDQRGVLLKYHNNLPLERSVTSDRNALDGLLESVGANGLADTIALVESGKLLASAAPSPRHHPVKQHSRVSRTRGRKKTRSAT